MITPVVQRWRARRDSYRLAGEPIETRLYEVAAIDREDAKTFVTTHHYDHSFPAARRSFGLFRGPELVGALVVSQPVTQTGSPFPGSRLQSPDLGRVVLLDDVPANGETWFLARVAELLRRSDDFLGLVSASDPAQRHNVNGEVVFGGHIGTIYQAFNAIYLGKGLPSLQWLFHDGAVFSRRAIQKIRARERGYRYSAELLETRGASLLGDGDSRAWLAEWLPKLTTRRHHPGHHRYALPLDRRARKHVLAQISSVREPYPKFEGAVP